MGLEGTRSAARPACCCAHRGARGYPSRSPFVCRRVRRARALRWFMLLLRAVPGVARGFVCFRSAPDGPRAPPPASRAGAGHPGAVPGAGTFEPGSVPGLFGSTAVGASRCSALRAECAHLGWTNALVEGLEAVDGELFE